MSLFMRHMSIERPSMCGAARLFPLPNPLFYHSKQRFRSSSDTEFSRSEIKRSRTTVKCRNNQRESGVMRMKAIFSVSRPYREWRAYDATSYVIRWVGDEPSFLVCDPAKQQERRPAKNGGTRCTPCM